MKFGDTLYQRSVPKWAAYNLSYNELKHLIKIRTTNGAPAPVPIPGQTDHRWSLLEDELYLVLKEQYDNIALFLRSKHGEIERRLAYLDKSVRSAKRSARLHSGRPSLQARKYQKLVQEAESIGEDIQSLSRFAALQKTAFRKILKKYRKWTNSDTLNNRLEVDVFSGGQLDLSMSDQMQHLAAQSSIIRDLEATLLNPDTSNQLSPTSSRFSSDSPATQITRAAQLGPLRFDAAMACTPFGEAAGSANYWIHVDNLEEAKVLLLRYMRDVGVQDILLNASPPHSRGSVTSLTACDPATHACYFDNAHRFVQDVTENAPSKVALCARWANTKEAIITMSDMSPRSDMNSTVSIKKKELAIALDRDSSSSRDKSASAANVLHIKDFLSQHRDVKALAECHSRRSRYTGLNNSANVATFAALDTEVVFLPFDRRNIIQDDDPVPQGQPFQHAILEIRWEFGRKPEVVRAFDTTHLAEKVPNFTLEAAAILSQNPNLGQPSWLALLTQDIRKVPVQTRTAARRQEPSLGNTSAPSSNSDSVFSAPIDQDAGGSETSPVESLRGSISHAASQSNKSKKKKTARIVAESPKRSQPAGRYYSEYDDPDSELYQQDAYTIFVDPNEEAPGMATMRKIGSFLTAPLYWTLWSEKPKGGPTDRTPLLTDSYAEDGDASSESDSDQMYLNTPKYKGLQGHVRPAERYRRRLSRRQRAFESTLKRICASLVVLSYVLLLLSAILLTSGRKKKMLEVDVGATVGVVMAVLCMILSVILVYMRREKLKPVERISFGLAIGMIIILAFAVVVGIVQKATHTQ